jgi:hypothetical protein
MLSASIVPRGTFGAKAKLPESLIVEKKDK